jgi:hypothetical protein
MTTLHKALARARSEDGVTMVIAMGVMLVTSLLLAATFLATQGDIRLSHTDTSQKEAYYASLAGVQEFEYELQVNPDYWQTCGKPTNELPQETSSSYKVRILPANGASECSTANPLETAIESTGTAANTFRVESIGYAGRSPQQKHTIVATFKVTGFLNFIYYTNHEDEDPSLYSAPAACTKETTYFPETDKDGCQLIEFASGDEINGPMHTNDAPCIGGPSSFGRKEHNPADTVEFYRGVNTSCGGTGTYYTASKSYIKGESLEPPKSDTSLETYANAEDIFSGVTRLELSGTTDKITVYNAALSGGKELLSWPKNGLIYVKQASGSCGYTYKTSKSDSKEEAENETNCANVYVKGSYSESLTVGSAGNVIINGEILAPTNTKHEPTGTATLGLIADSFVRVYHPVAETYKVSWKNASTEPAHSGTCGKVVELNGKVTNGSSTVTNLSSTSELAVGMEVSGEYIPLGTKVKEINSSTTEVVLTKAATKNVTTDHLTFISGSSLEYNKTLNLCVEKSPGSNWKLTETTPYEYHEKCNIFNKKEEIYEGEGLCQYTNNTEECDAPSLDEGEDAVHHWGSLENPYIYAAILSTTHSFVVDNFNCGEKALGNLNVYGAIAQNYRGIVGTGSGSTIDTGYIKDYKYDGRLAVDEPPYFLSPLNAGWKVARETSPTGG